MKEYIVNPPNNSEISNLRKHEIDIFQEIMKQFEDHEILFKVIKMNGQVKELSKNNCISLSLQLEDRIKSFIVNKKNNLQLKIFGLMCASEESVILMLSSLLLAAHHCICFEELSEESICKRIEAFKPDIIICREKYYEKLKNVSRLLNENIPIFSINIDNLNSSLIKTIPQKRSIYNNLSKLFTLFTSGSTGMPKSIVHGVEKYINYAKYTSRYFFGLKKGSVMFTATDAGWINGHTYAFYGPLLLGATSVINENPQIISLPRLLGKYLGELKVNCFYTSVTIFRFLRNVIKANKTLQDFSPNNIPLPLDRIGSCGEPLAHEIGVWAINFFKPKRKTIVNTYFQTETGGILTAPRDEDGIPSDYSCVGRPRDDLGITIAKNVMNNDRLKKENIEPNELLVCKSWDGIFLEVISDRETKYFTSEGYFRLHDVGYFDEEGFLYIGGRSDDVININGHRISTSEIENICISVKAINEVCAVSIPDKISGTKLILFYSLTNTTENIKNKIEDELTAVIRKNLSKDHLPKKFYFFESLPKTKSGKIMRRLMRDLITKNKNYLNTDYSTLANKEQFIKSKNNFLN